MLEQAEKGEKNAKTFEINYLSDRLILENVGQKTIYIPVLSSCQIRL